MEPKRALEATGAGIEKFAKIEPHFPFNTLVRELSWIILSYLKPIDYFAGLTLLNTREKKIGWINFAKIPMDCFPRKQIIVLLKTHGHFLEHFAIARPRIKNWRELLQFLSPEKLTLFAVPREYDMRKSFKQRALNPPKSNWLLQIAKFTELASLNLRKDGFKMFKKIKPIGVLAGLTNLRELDISKLEVKAEELKKLSALTNLTTLIAEFKTFSPSSTIEVFTTLTKLRNLSLKSTPLDDVAITTIGKLTTLQGLNLSDCNLGEVNLKPLFPLTNLTVLNMEQNNITEGVKSHFSTIHGLKFSNTPVIEDEGIMELGN